MTVSHVGVVIEELNDYRDNVHKYNQGEHEYCITTALFVFVIMLSVRGTI